MEINLSDIKNKEIPYGTKIIHDGCVYKMDYDEIILPINMCEDNELVTHPDSFLLKLDEILIFLSFLKSVTDPLSERVTLHKLNPNLEIVEHYFIKPSDLPNTFNMFIKKYEKFNIKKHDVYLAIFVKSNV